MSTALASLTPSGLGWALCLILKRIAVVATGVNHCVTLNQALYTKKLYADCLVYNTNHMIIACFPFHLPHAM